MIFEFDRDQMDSYANSVSSRASELESLSRRIRTIVSWFENQPHDSISLSGLVDSLEACARNLDKYGDHARSHASFVKNTASGFVNMHQQLTMKVPIADRGSASSGSASAQNGQSENTPLSEEELALLYQNFNRELMEILFKNCPSPNSLLSVLKMQDTGFLDKLVNGAWSVVTFDFRNAIQDPLAKRQYLFSNALNALKSEDIRLLNIEGLSDVWNIADDGIDVSKSLTFDKYMQIASTNDITIDRDVFSDLFDKFMNDKSATPQELNLALRNAGIPVEKVNGVMDDFDMFKNLNKITDVMDGIDEGITVCNNAAEVYNQLQIVNSLDSDKLLQTARVYIKTGDAEMVNVGKTLESLATASQGERITMIATGTLTDMGLDVLSSAGAKAAQNTLGSANPYVAVANVTTGVIDSLTGVNDIPKLTNQLLFAGDATQSTYQVFQKDYAAYLQNPSEANLQSTLSSYKAYCNTAIDSQNACAAIYDTITDSAIGGIFVNEEARGYSQMCKDTVTSFSKKLSSIDSYYQGYQTRTRPDTNI